METASAPTLPGAVETLVYQIPEGRRISVGAPAILSLPSGKILVAFDQMGPDAKTLTGKKGHDTHRNRWVQGRVMISADAGASWQLSATYPFRSASLFRDGGDVYLIGELNGALHLMRSPDGGTSWSAPTVLTDDLGLRLFPQSIIAADGFWLLAAMGSATEGKEPGMMIWRAPQGASLMNRKAWSAGPLSPGLTALLPPQTQTGHAAPYGKKPPAWDFLSLLHVPAGAHPWFEKEEVLLFGATHSGRCNIGVFLRVEEGQTIALARAPDDTPWCWLPLPGGHARHTLFADESAKAFVLLGHDEPLALTPQAADPHHRLGLWFSANLAVWQPAAVAMPEKAAEGNRRKAAAAVMGADLVAAYTLGEKDAIAIAFTRILNFRTLARKAR